jgi:hypothetical protein
MTAKAAPAASHLKAISGRRDAEAGRIDSLNSAVGICKKKGGGGRPLVIFFLVTLGR